MRQPRLRWIADRAEPLERILERLGAPSASLVGSGAVFVDRRRALVGGNTLVQKGQVVEVFGAEPYRERAPSVDEAELLARRGDLVAAHKPVGIPTEPDRSDKSSLRALIAKKLGVKEASLHAASRLDKPVSGIVLFACGPAGRRHLSDMRQQGRVRRRYVALAASLPQPERGVWQTPIRGDASTTRYATAGVAGSRALLALEPVTGRVHQLREHAARAGLPLIGDRAYGGQQRWVDADGSVRSIERVALHALWVTLPDECGDTWHISSDFPSDLMCLWQAWGGDERAWEVAAASELIAV
jgi:23S rRNA pseudouridine955/2504/2580 synthase/23S rRNA pseudouridine1911/1915/1917 synthase